jgi:hypothetical protein
MCWRQDLILAEQPSYEAMATAAMVLALLGVTMAPAHGDPTNAPGV